MRPIFLMIAVIFMTACGAENRQNIESEDLKSERPALSKTTHESLELAAAISHGSAHAAAHEKPNDPVNTSSVDGITRVSHDYTEGEAEEIDRLTDEAESIHEDVRTIWNESFSPMHSRFYESGLVVEQTAAQLEALHESYNTLEMRLDNLETPAFFTPTHVETFDQMKTDLSLAISNRTLALIEFKLMNHGGDYEMNETLLEVHVENSEKYLSNASDSIGQLETLYSDANGNEYLLVDE